MSNPTEKTISRNESSTDASSKPSEFFPCTHAQTIKHKTRVNCFSCGLFMHEGGVKAYKSQKMKFGAYFDPSRYYSSTLKQRQPKIVLNVESEYFLQRGSLLDIVWETSDKLKLSINTVHLAIYFMDFAMSKLTTVPLNLFPVYAAICVMLAAKSIELDERIPFISKLQRYSGLTNYKPKEFAVAEQAVLRELGWTLQCVTPIDVLDYFFSQGVLFSNDMLLEEHLTAQTSSSVASEDNALKEKNIFNDSTPVSNKSLGSSKATNSSSQKGADENRDFTVAFNSLSIGEKENSNGISSASMNGNKKKLFVSDLSESKIFALVQKMEKDYQRLANLLVRDFRFYDFDMKIITGAAVCFIRKVNGIATAWNRQLSAISNNQVTENLFQDCLSIMESRFRGNFVVIPPAMTSSNNNSIALAQSSAAKRAGLMSPVASNIMQRDSENKAPGSITTPTKYLFKNNLSNSIASSSANHQQQNSSTAYNKISGAKLPPFNHHHESASTMPFSSNTNSSNASLGNGKVNSINYFQTNSNQQALLNNNSLALNHKNSLPAVQGSSASISQNQSYMRQTASSIAAQQNNFLGLQRFGSNIL